MITTLRDKKVTRGPCGPDPQAQALHVDSNTVRTVQAAAMVGMCLAAGYIIAFGAGLIWPRHRSL